MYRKMISLILVVISLFTVTSCVTKKRPMQISGFECKLDKGLWHDVHLTNESGLTLREVKLTLSIVGEDGKVHSQPRYFARWQPGEKNIVSLTIAKSPVNVQKITITGTCMEGEIASSWVF